MDVIRRTCATLLIAVALATTSFAATSTSALINQQLDVPIKTLELDGTLPQAMDAIGQQTGVRVEADPAVWDLLPWGEQTNLAAKVANQTLRQTLAAVTKKLGLDFVLTDEAIELRPQPALRRLGRRATVSELTVLDVLAATPFEPPADAKLDHLPAADALAKVDAKLEAINSPFAIENRAYDETHDKFIALPRGATLADALNAVAGQTTATWYPWGRSLVIVGKVEQVRSQLNKTLTARYNGVDLHQVLLELFQRAGVDFTIQPGVFQRVPAEFRSVRLTLDSAPIAQALESICGVTGLTYRVNDQGVYVCWPDAK